MTLLVCPDCGSTDFYADHHAVVRRTYIVDARGYSECASEEVQDVERDFDALTCEGCGAEWQEDDLMGPDCSECGRAVERDRTAEGRSECEDCDSAGASLDI